MHDTEKRKGRDATPCHSQPKTEVRGDTELKRERERDSKREKESKRERAGGKKVFVVSHGSLDADHR